MLTITKLAYKKPKKQFTAIFKCNTLKQHREAFLNFYNKRGFKEEDDNKNTNSLFAFLETISGISILTNDQYIEYTSTIINLSNLRISERNAKEIIAHIFNYRNSNTIELSFSFYNKIYKQKAIGDSVTTTTQLNKLVRKIMQNRK